MAIALSPAAILRHVVQYKAIRCQETCAICIKFGEGVGIFVRKYYKEKY